MSRRSKIIVGIDYGTTYSGISFVHSSAASFKDIKPFTAWPGAHAENNEHYEKAPSQIAYAAENPGLRGDVWGYQVKPEHVSCSWTKLLLDKNALKTQFDGPALLDYNDPAHLDSVANGLMRLPQGKTAARVVQDYLKALHDTLMGSVRARLGEDILRVTPMEYWVTIPAIWSDEAKQTTLTAAKMAGFGARRGDEVNLIPEPEAAANLAIRTALQTDENILRPNTGIIVCDCGGGTVDVTTYTLERFYPKVQLVEACVGIGGKCGGTYIDRNLHALLLRRFGKAFSNLKPERIGPGSRFMREFEAAKRAFTANDPNQEPSRLRLVIPELSRSEAPVEGYDSEYGEILLSHADMLDCFQPVMTKILELVSQQEAEVAKTRAPKIKTLVLVGGLGACPFVQESLQVWCQQRSIQMIQPWSGSWSAVVCGAALRGLEGNLIQKRLCRRHYGQSLSVVYDAKIHSKTDDRWSRRFTYPFENLLRVPDYMCWRIARGATVDSTTKIVNPFFFQHYADEPKEFTTKLYACSAEGMPPPDDPRADSVELVGEIVCDCSAVDFGRFQKTWSNGLICWKVDMELEISLGARQGTLLCRSLCQGQEVGRTSIRFSGTAEEYGGSV